MNSNNNSAVYSSSLSSAIECNACETATVNIVNTLPVFPSNSTSTPNPDFSMDSFRAFDGEMRFEEEEFFEEESEYEAPPRKERMTRAERLAKKKERLAKKKALELERKKREAEKRGENPEEVTAPGYEPTIDPNLL